MFGVPPVPVASPDVWESSSFLSQAQKTEQCRSLTLGRILFFRGGQKKTCIMDQDTIFITGAGQGIGKATALLFARRGWYVGLSDVNLQAVEALAEEIGPEQCSVHRMDVRDVEQVQQALTAFGQRTGQRMKVLFNNAGILFPGGFERMPLQQHHALVDINFTGLINVTHIALPMLKNTPGSTVLSMCSASATYGNPELTTYAATKSAVKSLTEGWNLLFQKHGIHVADLLPAYVRTGMVAAAKDEMQLPERDVKLNADDIAKAAWKAVHDRRRMHHYIGFDSNLFRFCKWLLPRPVLEGILKASFYKKAMAKN